MQGYANGENNLGSVMVKLREEWLTLLADEFSQSYMRELSIFLRQEKAAGKIIYPDGSNIFSALEATPPSAVRVVILGQDPYHGQNQAHGLCFSVRRGRPTPPSLRNIYQELQSDLGIEPPAHGNLNSWAEQGVLLLNSVLTVEAGQAGSHQGRGWECFTDRIVTLVSADPSPKVFLLWGSYAAKKGAGIDGRRHLILKAPHPSPLSAYRGFFGCAHFSAANRFLEAENRGAVDWQLPA